MLERLFKRVTLVVAMAMAALTAFEVQAQFSVESGKIIYYDPYMRIEISGTWASASGAGNVVTVVNPSGAYFRVKLVSADGYEEVERETITTYQNGYIKFKVESESIDEDSHTVELYVEIEADIDLDCDADWDGDIDDGDDPIEESNGGLVGLHKTAPLKLSFGSEKFKPTGGQLSFAVEGGVVLCKDEEGTEVIAEAPYPGRTVCVEVAATDIQGTYYVKGVSTSKGFNDSKVIATYALPSGASAEDTVGFTVVSVDIKIDGQSEDDEEKDGAYALFVKDFDEFPYAPRATNCFKTVEMWIYPKDFPEDLRTNIWIEVDGALDHLMEKRPMSATWGEAPYSPATNRYTIADLGKQESAEGGPYFALHGHEKSKELRDRNLHIKEPKTSVEDSGLFTVVKLNVVPDYDRDHIIGDEDEKQLCMDKKFYWWINDDHDLGDCASMYKDHGSEIHGEGEFKYIDEVFYVSEKPNCEDKKVNGKTDLLDFFPMWLDAHEMFKLFKKEGANLTLVMMFNGLGIVGTKLQTNSAGDFLTQSCFTADGAKELCEADVDVSGVTDFSGMPKFIENVVADPQAGILMTEGNGGGMLVLMLFKECKVKGETVNKAILHSVTPISTRDVRDFYSVVSLYGGKAEEVQKRKEELDDLFCDEKTVFSLHGFKVDAPHAEGWHSEFFKRLYQSQSSARFIGVTWDGAQDDDKWYHPAGLFYHQDAAHAFRAGQLLKGFLDGKRASGEIKGEVSMMAHSLGNMVVSSAVKLEDMEIDRYIMLDAAVAAEAYDGECDDNRMINPSWKEYPKKSFCSKWYKLFEGASDIEEDGKKRRDARRDLKWPELFKNMGCSTYNYYSLGDEVFELADEITMASGFDIVMDGVIDMCRFCWQKQEVAKGANMFGNMIVDDNPGEGVAQRSGGWGFYYRKIKRTFLWLFEYEVNVVGYTSDQAANASSDDLMRVPVFAHTPEWVYEWEKYDNQQTRENKVGLLNHVVPAMSQAAGRCELKAANGNNRNLDTDTYRQGWGRNGGSYNTRWLHCDLKDMAYFYNFKAWDSITIDGNFRKGK